MMEKAIGAWILLQNRFNALTERRDRGEVSIGWVIVTIAVIGIAVAVVGVLWNLANKYIGQLGQSGN